MAEGKDHEWHGDNTNGDYEGREEREGQYKGTAADAANAAVNAGLARQNADLMERIIRHSKRSGLAASITHRAAFAAPAAVHPAMLALSSRSSRPS
jgi:hypothetical protein